MIDAKRLDWARIASSLDAEGHSVIRGLLAPDECARVGALFDDDALFRKRIDMARHGFGRGAYAYFDEPLPDVVAGLREELYLGAAGVANRWAERLGEEERWPNTLAELRRRCAAAGQTKPTPLLLRYGPGDHNRLHQDVYGEVAFPLQVVILLSEPGRDFEGGELVLTEQRPRAQSRAHVATLGLGDAAIFATRHRPADGARGAYRLTMRHGVATVRSGERRTLGIIFHDAA